MTGLATCSFPALAAVSIVVMLAASRALETGPAAPGGFLREVGGALSLVLLVLGAARAADRASRGRRAARGSRLRKKMLRLAAVALHTGREAALVSLLAFPALATAWEWGATPGDLGTVVLGLVSAAAWGIVLGAAAGSAGLAGGPGCVVGACAGALVLWPASLGWAAVIPQRFPAPELPATTTAGLLLASSFLAATCAATSTGERMARRAGRRRAAS